MKKNNKNLEDEYFFIHGKIIRLGALLFKEVLKWWEENKYE